MSEKTTNNLSVDLGPVAELINRQDTLKIVVSVDGDGCPHAVPKGTLRATDTGLLEYAELLESSRSYRNVTGSIWFGRKVAVLVVGAPTEGGRAAFEITGRVERILVAGAKFEDVYRILAESRGFDVAAVVTIVPQSVEDMGAGNKIAEQEKSHPFFTHLDRLAV